MKSDIVLLFPGLNNDPYFKITSKKTDEYNCIAWAALKNDVFWWPDPMAHLIDGVDWPFNLPFNTSLQNFIDLYTHLGYTQCATWKFEDKLQKVALYVDPNTLQVTHAARQNFNGVWTSKLGRLHDISHKDPFSLEGQSYGCVKAFMCRENVSYDIKKIKKLIEKA